MSSWFMKWVKPKSDFDNGYEYAHEHFKHGGTRQELQHFIDVEQAFGTYTDFDRGSACYLADHPEK